jgi:succinoglycan biosynthesis transport protein ExoP
MPTQNNNPGLSLQDYWTVLRRRRFLMAWVFLAVSVAMTGVTLLVPERYRSAAFIRVEQPDLQKGIVDTAVESTGMDNRIDRTRDRVVTNANLRPIIEELSLYPDVPPDERPSYMRGDIDTPRVLSSSNPKDAYRGPETIGFQVGYMNESPQKAQLVAHRLAELFLEENVASRTATVAEASRVLAEQAADLKGELTRTEEALAEFKQQHAGSLPEDTNLNKQRLDRAQGDLDDVEREIRTLEERKNMLLAQLAETSPSATLYSEDGDPILGTDQQLEVLRRQYISMAARYSPEHPDVIKLRKQIEALSGEDAPAVDTASLQSELEAKRAELADLKQRYSDDHPDVQRVQRTIDELLDQLKTAPAVSAAPPPKPNNPAYIQLQVQLDGVNNELAAQRQQRVQLNQRIQVYEDQLAKTPDIERQLTTLTRDYDIAKRDYNDIREKQTEAERAITVESQQRAERYILQRDAGLPDSPAQPSHLTIVLIGVFLGIMAALGAGLLREALDTTVRGARDLRAILETPPIALVPSIDTQRDIWRRLLRRGVLAASFAAAAFFGVTAAV